MGMNMASTAYMSDQAVIVYIQTVTIQGVINGTGIKQAQKKFNR